jgi:hypothetical protein
MPIVIFGEAAPIVTITLEQHYVLYAAANQLT